MDKISMITRKGLLNLLNKQTSNQCAKQGHEIYHYEVKVLFTKDTKLNGNGWIIDHQLFDDAIQKVHVNSCEIMSHEILNSVEKVLVDNDLGCIGIKLKIQPAFVVEENSAYFTEFRCHEQSDLPIVMCM